MTPDEWNNIVNTKIKALWPRSMLTDAMLNIQYERRLRWFRASLVEAAVIRFAEDSPDSSRGLLDAIGRFCRQRNQGPAETHDEHGLTAQQRRNVIKQIRGKDPARFEDWRDDDIWQAWLKQEKYHT